MSDSSDTNNVSPVVHKGKRKAVVLSDSKQESDSSSASDLEVSVVKRSGKRKARIRESDSDSDSSIENQRKIKRIPRVPSDSDGSSSDESEIIHTKKVARVVCSDDSNQSDSDSELCTSEFDLSDNGFEDNTSDGWESDWISDSEVNLQDSSSMAAEQPTPTNSNSCNVGNISDSSDGETEKCPICLFSFNQQEVGTPETCDHSFCAECIQEWSKNVNTCPVDRQTFTLILVRKRYNGKVIRRVPVDVRRPSEDELIQEDPTYCEICGQSDREDRLLLCDGCDLGYHLECLDPPMETVPVEEWFCSICRGRASQEHRPATTNQRQQQLENLRRIRIEPRLLPRTSQSERIRATIETNRSNYAGHLDQQSISSGFEDVSMPGTSHSGSNSTTRSSRNVGPTTARKRKKTTKRKKRRVLYKTTYEICEATGEKVAVKTRRKTTRRRRRKKRKSQRQRRTVKPKTVKKRLAFQLGMCPPKTAGLAVPEVKVRANTSTTGHIGYQRTQAGIPTLHLFGQRDGLDYFSGGSDDEMFPLGGGGGGPGSGSATMLTHSRTNSHTNITSMGALRRAARRKAAILSPIHPASVNPCDILGSILDSQTKLHSKHSKLSVNRDGTVRIETDRLSKPENSNTNNNNINNNNDDIIKPDVNILGNNSPPPLDLTSQNNELETTQAPMFPGRGGGGGGGNRQPYGFNRSGYRGNDNRYDNHSGGNYNNFQSGGNRGGNRAGGNFGFGNNQRDNFPGGNYMNFHHHHHGGGPPPFRGRGSPRFPLRRPQYGQHPNENQSHQLFQVEETETVEPVDLVLDDPSDQLDASRLQEQEDVDIYSDIEDNVQTLEQEEEEQQQQQNIQVKPPPVMDTGAAVQGLVSQAYNNSDDDDSGSELIIDDDKNDPVADAEEPPPIAAAIATATDLTVTNTRVEEVPNVIVPVPENRQLEPFSQQVVKQVVQEVMQEHLNTPSTKPNVQYDDDDMSNDDCPNFSIYSSTSMDIAKSTDFSVDIPKEAEEEEAEAETESKQPEQTLIENTEKINIQEDDNDDVKSEEEKKDEWPSGDEWDTCDAENAQKSWDQPYVPPQDKTDTPEDEEVKVIDVEPGEIITTQNETEPEKDIKQDESPIVPQDSSDETVINESLTPPLPLLPIAAIPKPCEQPAPEKPTSYPIKIAFNPNSRKLQKLATTVAAPAATAAAAAPSIEKEKVIQLYDDSDYEEWELKNDDKIPKQPNEENSTDAAELEKLTEAISEEERSYTPCLDEKDPTKAQYSEDEKNMGAGIGGMDTEMISDEERNDFDESHDMKTISDGDALEINAKESELELARPEDYEEGEIVEKSGIKQTVPPQETQTDKSLKPNVSEDEKKKRPKKKPEKETTEKEKPPEADKTAKKSEFKKISKSNKERNYRGDKERSKSKEHAKGKENRETNSKEELRKKKERKRDLERYNVRSIISEKPKKDQFGRDIKSASRSSRSATPRRSRSHSWNRAKKRRRRSRSLRRSRSRSHTPRSRSRGRSPRRSRSFRRSKSPRRSRSRSFRRSRTPKNKRHREIKSLSRERDRVRYRNRSRRSADRTQRKKKNRSVSRNRMRTSRSPSASKHRVRNDWPRQADTVRHHSYTREWTPSWSRSPTPPRPIPRHNLPQSMSPSWTPPIAIDKGPVQPENLTVILNNDVNKTKKKEKRKKADKKSRDEYRKRKRGDRTPPPSKEVFASGDNILVSVSFNKTTTEESTVQREVLGVKRKRDSVSDSSKKKKEKIIGEKKKKRAKSPRTKKKNKEIANLKPVAIIDLDRSPFKELTPSPKDIIVLSDSDNCEKEDEAMMVHHHEMLQEELMALGAQQQEDSAPQSPNNYLNTTGPKTPPEPQIKFLLTSKQSQLRAINNPLHDPNDEGDPEIDPQEELEHRLDDILHKGPNTPPEPPSSPPSSPDAYDPFDPTKSRSPTPESSSQNQPALNTPGDTKESESDLVDLAVGPLESSLKSTGTLNDSVESKIGSSQIKATSPERPQTRTPPIISEQTTESSDNKNDSTEKSTKSPERNPIGVIINQQVQLPAVVKPIISTSAVISSTPTISSTALPRTNIFSTSTAVGGTPRIATSVPQRIILPTPAKSSPAKMSPLKTSPSKPPIKSTPIKPMPSKTMISKLPVPNMKPLTPIRKGAPAKPTNRNVGQNGNEVIDVDLDFDSPYSPGSSDYEDLFEPPADTAKTNARQKNTKSPAKQNANTFDNLFGSSPVFRNNKTTKSKTNAANKVPVKMNKKTANQKSNSKTVGVKIDEDNLKILDDLPNSAVEMQVKDKFLKKLNRQERVVEEVKLVLKPHYNKKHITKEQYKDILRKAVPKICHNRSGEINPKKIQNLIEAYVKKARHARKPTNTTNSGANPVTQQPKPAKTTFWS